MTTAGKPQSSQGKRFDNGRARLLVASERLRALEAEFFEALDDVRECRPNQIRSLARLEGLRVQLIAVACRASRLRSTTSPMPVWSSSARRTEPASTRSRPSTILGPD